MTRRDIAALACKILSIYAIISALGTLESSFVYLGYWMGSPQKSSTQLQTALVAAVPFVVQSALAIFLWILADALAVAMAPDGNEAPLRTNLRGHEVLTIAFWIIGVLTLVQTVPLVIQVTIRYFLIPAGGFPSLAAMLAAQAAAGIVQLLLGLGLLLGARGLAARLRPARDEDGGALAGLPPADKTDAL